jgi:hypothetical protein
MVTPTRTPEDISYSLPTEITGKVHVHVHVCMPRNIS